MDLVGRKGSGVSPPSACQVSAPLLLPCVSPVLLFPCNTEGTVQASPTP